MFSQRAYGADRNHIGHTSAFQYVNVGAEVDLRWRYFVAATMTRQEDQLDTGQVAKQQLVGRSTKWRFNPLPALVRKPFDVIHSAAANDADFSLHLNQAHNY